MGLIYCLGFALLIFATNTNRALGQRQGYTYPSPQTSFNGKQPSETGNFPQSISNGYQSPAAQNQSNFGRSNGNTRYPEAAKNGGSSFSQGIKSQTPAAESGQSQGKSESGYSSEVPSGFSPQKQQNGYGQSQGPQQTGGKEEDGTFPLNDNQNFGSPQAEEEEEGDFSAIPGQPQVDYPILSSIPETTFKCDQQQYPGYYADIETRCQVFHICTNNGTYDFLCPNGTIFDQERLVCVWWNQFECDSAPSFYQINANLYKPAIDGVPEQTGAISGSGSASYPSDRGSNGAYPGGDQSNGGYQSGSNGFDKPLQNGKTSGAPKYEASNQQGYPRGGPPGSGYLTPNQNYRNGQSTESNLNAQQSPGEYQANQQQSNNGNGDSSGYPGAEKHGNQPTREYLPPI